MLIIIQNRNQFMQAKWHEHATFHNPKLNIFAYLLTVFIAHLCHLDVNRDIKLMYFPLFFAVITI